MSLTKTTAIDQITVTENGIVLYREATRRVKTSQAFLPMLRQSAMQLGHLKSLPLIRLKQAELLEYKPCH